MGYLETQTTLWWQHITPGSLYWAHSRLPAHTLVSMRLLLVFPSDPSILIWFVLGSPLGSLASHAPSLGRLIICVISLALISHSPVGFSSHRAQHMPHV